jgi:hypothetical protein
MITHAIHEDINVNMITYKSHKINHKGNKVNTVT